MSHAIRKRKLGIPASAFSSDAREAVARAAQMGFDGVTFSGQHGSLDLTNLPLSAQRDVQRLLRDRHIALIGLRMDVGQRGFEDKADIDQLLHRVGQMMLAATGLGAPLLLLELPALPEPVRTIPVRAPITQALAGSILLPDPTGSPAETRETNPPDEKAIARADLIAGEIARLADRHGCQAALSSGLSSMAALQRVLAAANCPWFGIDLDPVDLLRDEQEADAIFSSLARVIQHVRGRDAILGSEHRTRPAVPGQGSVDFPALLGRLDNADYHGFITIDPANLPADGAMNALSYLRTMSV